MFTRLEVSHIHLVLRYQVSGPGVTIMLGLLLVVFASPFERDLVAVCLDDSACFNETLVLMVNVLFGVRCDPIL